ncbi:MAG: hypothetical protein RJB66_201 [Pseudomonadota bacterium]|jgi:hypothetical protein
MQFISEERFSLQPELAKRIPHASYCPSCFDSQVANIVTTYEHTVERARDILVYEKTQGKETRFFKRTEKPVRVEKCEDRAETLLRLAFYAAAAGFNGLIDVDIKAEKLRNGSYQKTVWSGSGIPTNIESRKVMKDRSIWHNPN